MVLPPVTPEKKPVNDPGVALAFPLAMALPPNSWEHQAQALNRAKKNTQKQKKTTRKAAFRLACASSGHTVDGRNPAPD